MLEVGHIDILIARYLSGEADASEKAELEAWEAASGENRRYVAELELIWKESMDLEEENRPDVQAALDRLRERLKERPVIRMRHWWAVAIAAGIIVVVSLLIIKNIQKHQSPIPEFVKIRANAGEQTDSLPDGSVIVLSPNAELVYPAAFNASRRDVQLKGDAFFSVFHDATRPFRIALNDITITVLGTSFAVKDSSGITTISVKTGLVKVARNERSMQLSAHEKLMVPVEGPWFKTTDSVPVQTAVQAHPVKTRPVETKRDPEYYRNTMRSILEDIVKEGVVPDRDSIQWAALTDSVLIVNGMVQPGRLYQKLRTRYLTEPGNGYFYGPVQITGRGYFFDKKEINP